MTVKIHQPTPANLPECEAGCIERKTSGLCRIFTSVEYLSTSDAMRPGGVCRAYCRKVDGRGRVKSD